MGFSGKVVLVTGSSQGIGTATARAFAARGAAVVVNYNSHPDKAEEVVQSIRTAGGTAIAVKADVSDAAEVEAMMGRTSAEFGRLDVLVNNAGTAIGGLVADITPETFRRVIDVNLIGTFNCCHHALPMLRAAGGASIINISSINAGISDPTIASYAASKAAIEAFSRSLMKEEAHNNIRVNVVQPGPTWTEMQVGGWSEERITNLAKRIPMGRLGQPEEIADAVVFLASDEARYVDGAILTVSGGILGVR